MRSRTSLVALLLVVISFAVPTAAHAGIPFFGPIIGPETGLNDPRCALSWGALIIVINNIISLLITLAIVFVAPITIAYAGFLYVVNPVNPSGIQKAKGILLNTVVGIVIALAGYLIVAGIMAVLYHPNNSTWGAWTNIIYGSSNDTCIQLAGSLSQAGPGYFAPGISTGALNAPPSGKVGTACDPAAVLAGAAAGGYTLTATQANTLACIAAPESSCGKTLINYNWNNGSSAVGAFQVLLQTNASCYENTACYAAIGSLRGPLNCVSGFSGGNPIPGSVVAQQCIQAASNLDCSASAAACLLQKNGGSFSPWQADVNSAKQTGCITSGT